MKIFIIIYKEFIQGIRDKKNFVLMIFMPTLLTMILSTVFKEDISIDKDLFNINIKWTLPKYEIKSLNIEYLEVVLKKMNIDISYEFNIDNYKKDTDVVISEKNKEINIYYDEIIKVEGGIVSNLIKSVISNNTDFQDGVKLKKMNEDSINSALQYYGITMITLTMLFSSVTGAYGIIKERNEKLLYRTLTLPISLREFIIGKIIGALIISILQIGIVVTISKGLFQVNFGESTYLIIIILLLESAFAISFGILIGSIINDNKSCWLILLSIIMISGLIGGAFIPLNTMNGDIVKYLSPLSPITYINKCIFRIVYLNDDILLKYMVIFYGFFIAVFTKLAIVFIGGKDESIDSCI